MPWPKTVAAKLGLPGRAIIGLVDCDGLDLERLVRQLLSTVPLGICNLRVSRIDTEVN